MKASVNIKLRSNYTNADGENLVILRVIIDKKKKEYSLNFSVKPHYFDENKKEISSKHPRHALFNKEIRPWFMIGSVL